MFPSRFLGTLGGPLALELLGSPCREKITLFPPIAILTPGSCDVVLDHHTTFLYITKYAILIPLVDLGTHSSTFITTGRRYELAQGLQVTCCWPSEAT